jgi:heptosyltransferase-2
LDWRCSNVIAPFSDTRKKNLLIDVLATPWVAPIYEASQDVHQVVAAPFQHKKLQLGLRWKTSKSLKTAEYSACYILPNSWKSLIIPLIARIPRLIGYDGESRNFFLTKSLPNPPKKDRPSAVRSLFGLSFRKSAK